MVRYSGDDFYCDVAIPRREPIDVVLEDDDVLAFHHTRPFWPVHLVVIPKRHVDSLLTLDDPVLTSRLLQAVQHTADGVLKANGAASVMTNLGNYQDSKHLHFHVRSGPPLASTPETLEPRSLTLDLGSGR